jgi:hypothetical protein
MERQTIEVRKYLEGQDEHGSETIGPITGNYGKYEVVGTIKRKVWAEQIGNFNPVFCRFQKRRTLVHSDEGDLSDPFRRDESYLKKLFVTTYERRENGNPSKS